MELYCKNCWNFGRCSAVGRTVAFAVNHGVCRDFDEVKPLTNAQKIRAMSDEELAAWIAGMTNVCECCAELNECESPRGFNRCSHGVEDWLKQPYESGE